ncbi:MAG: Na/Pi cotransporter family protein [Lachnospiraceae bacterium]|nr:Na/Pi cotransporter family protein [Lachnospiraceae bacterium]
MTLDDLKLLFEFVGGLGMFLYGMNIMADGLQKSAGSKLKNIMSFLTKNRLVAVLVGAGVTAIIQSSSATTVMVVGFVNAGMLNLAQAVGVIMGANIGTTITAWIVSLSEFGSIFKPEFYAPVLVGFGAFCIIFSKNEKKKKIGEIFIGIGLLFIGLTFMSDAIKPYRDSQIFVDMFTTLGKNPLLAIIAGAVVTAIIQSSSASVGILQTLAMNGIVSWKSAVFITLGQNIGTCVTAVISGAGAGKNAKRASIIHLLFNVIGTVIFSIVMFALFKFNATWGNSTISSVEISIFHTVFNVTCTVLLFPFAKGLVKLSEFIIRDSKEEEEEETLVEETKRKLDRRLLSNPSFALEAAKKEVDVMGEMALNNLKTALNALQTEGGVGDVSKVYAVENDLNHMEKMLTAFLVEVDNLSLTEHQHLLVKNMFYAVSDIERVGDHCENIAELAEIMKRDDIVFSKKGSAELVEISDETINALTTALQARSTDSKKTALMVEQYENHVDELEDLFREKHIARLSKGKCTPENGVVFLDIMSNLERISDHACNLAGYVIAEAEAKQSMM